MSSRLVLIATAAVALGGCNTMHKNIGMEDPALGEAVRYNAAIQTIDPDPVYQAGDAQPGDSGVKGVAAVKRYRTDAVKAVETVQTTGGSSPR